MAVFYSFDDTYKIYAYRENNIRIVTTQGEGTNRPITELTDDDLIKAPRFQLMDERGIINISSLKNVYIQLAIMRSNNTEDLLDCVVVDKEKSIVACPIRKSLTDVVGKVKGEIRLITTNAVTKFHGINFFVYSGISDTAAAQSTQFSDLISALQQVCSIIDGGSEGTISLDTVIQHNGTKPVASGILYDYLNDNFLTKADKTNIDRDILIAKYALLMCPFLVDTTGRIISYAPNNPATLNSSSFINQDKIKDKKYFAYLPECTTKIEASTFKYPENLKQIFCVNTSDKMTIDNMYVAKTTYNTSQSIINRVIDTLIGLSTDLSGKADKSTTYTKTEVDAKFDIKADKSSVYTKSESDTMLAQKESLSNKITEMTDNDGDGDYPTSNAVKNYLEDNYYNVDEAENVFQPKLYAGENITISSSVQGKAVISADLSAKYDSSNIEEGKGELTPAQAIYDGCEGSFNYSKIGKTVTVALNITTLVAGKNYVQFAGLPFNAITASRLSSIAVYTTANKLVNIRLHGSWLYISSPDTTFAEGEKINSIITYIIN